MLILPSSLSGMRLLLAAAFPGLRDTWRLGAVIGAGLSDGLDGLLARRLGAVTWWGALLDAVSDKVFTLTVLICLTLEQRLAPWQSALLLARDLAVLLLSFYVAATGQRHRLRQVEPRPLGKATTVALLATFGSLLVGFLPAWMPTATLTITAALSVAAAADYVLHVVRPAPPAPTSTAR